MKKLSLLVILCMLLTIGGVYATWTYATVENLTEVSGAASITMGEKVIQGQEGTYSVDCTGVVLTVDPKTGTTHNTALSVSGNIVITFTPNVSASEEIKTNAVSSQYSLTLSDDWKYDNSDILTLTAIGAEAHSISWSKQTDGSFTYTIDANVLAAYLNLTEVTLDTVAKYEAYKTALNSGSVTITVSDTRVLNAD